MGYVCCAFVQMVLASLRTSSVCLDMKTLLLVLCTLLQGCATVLHQDQFQDLVVQKGEQSPKPVLIWWLSEDDTQRLQELCKGAEGYKLACAKWDVDLSVCEKNNNLSFCRFKSLDVELCVIITPTKTSYKVLGHEVRHCFHKHFH